MSLFTRFGHALYGRKPISRLAQSHPVIVRLDDRLDSVINRALDRLQEDVYDDLIVVDRFGKYYGILSVKQLVLRQTDLLVNTIDQRALAQKQAQELERINKMKSQFISCITHELRAPVNTMIGLAELIQFAQNSGDLKKVGNYASLSLTAATNLRALVNNILDLAKIEAGRLEVQIDTFNLSRLVVEVMEATEILLRDKDVRIVSQCPSQDIFIQSDPIKVRQILTNIANNAAKFTELGQIIFKVEFRADQILLSIADTGIGIKKEDQNKLFKSFSQVGDIKTRSHEGTGLGLVITKYLVELLHGKLFFESDFGVGTTFIIIFPCKPQFKERENHHD